MKVRDYIGALFVWTTAFLIALLAFLMPPAHSAALIPEPVRTIIEEAPRPVRTILERVEELVPGPTVTVPGPTVTETIRVPAPGPTVTVTETERVTETVTSSPSVTPTGQPVEPGATVVPTPEPVPTPTPTVIERDGPERVVEVGIPEVVGVASIITLMAIALIGVFLAYYRGYKDSDAADKKLLVKLRDDILGR